MALEESKYYIIDMMLFSGTTKEYATKLLDDVIEMAVAEYVRKYIDCGNCRYENLISTNTPCNGCVNYSNWEAKL